MLINSLLLAGIEKIINRYLALDPDAVAALAQLSGRALRVSCKGFPELYVLPQKKGVYLSLHWQGHVDASIETNVIALLSLRLQAQNYAQMAKNIHISGDGELVSAISRIINHVSIDWEEQLSYVLGDKIAHQVHYVMSNILQVLSHNTQTLCRNVTEYLQEEARFFPSREEVEDFFADLYALRDDVARFEARLDAIFQCQS